MIQKYIEGDLVITKTEPNNFTPSGIVCTFEKSLERDMVLIMAINGIDSFVVEKEQVAPIPLTPEILEKNGWMLYHLYYWFVEKECLKLRLLEFDNYTWNACIGDNVIRINMYSVSDLQHLLFGLGLNSEMEV